MLRNVAHFVPLVVRGARARALDRGSPSWKVGSGVDVPRRTYSFAKAASSMENFRWTAPQRLPPTVSTPRVPLSDLKLALVPRKDENPAQQEEDLAQIRAFLDGLDDETWEARFGWAKGGDPGLRARAVDRALPCMLDGATILCRDKGRVIAIAQLNRNPDSPHAAEIAIVVQPEYQGIGIGANLHRACAQVATELGYTQLEGEVLPGSDPAAAQLVRSQGFTKDDDCAFSEIGRWRKDLPAATPETTAPPGEEESKE